MRLIDADAMIAYIKMRIRNEMVIAWLCRIIGEATTIEAEPVKRGTWKLVEFQSSPLDTDQALMCTNCGFVHQHDAWFNRCPNCGARMDGENDE